MFLNDCAALSDAICPGRCFDEFSHLICEPWQERNAERASEERNLSHFKDNPHILITILPADSISFKRFFLSIAPIPPMEMFDFLSRRFLATIVSLFCLYHAHDNLHLINHVKQQYALLCCGFFFGWNLKIDLSEFHKMCVKVSNVDQTI